MAFNLFRKTSSTDVEEAFWQWFIEHENRLYAFEQNQEVIFDDLHAEMNKVHEDLTFEFSPVLSDGRREFVISAGGIKTAFPAVESLYQTAPKLERWKWIQYRPRRTPINKVAIGDKEISADEVRYLLFKDGEKVGIVLFLDGYDEKESVFGQISYLLLDEALGEYAVEMQVGFIDLQPRESEYFSRSLPLADLPAHFDEYFSS